MKSEGDLAVGRTVWASTSCRCEKFLSWVSTGSKDHSPSSSAEVKNEWIYMRPSFHAPALSLSLTAVQGLKMSRVYRAG